MSVKGICPMERHIFPIQFCPVAIILEYMLLSDPLAISHIHSDAESITEDGPDNEEVEPLFRVAKSVAILSITDGSISVMTSRTTLIKKAPNLNSVRNGIVHLVSAILNALAYVLTTVSIANVSMNPTKPLKRMLIGAGTGILEVIAHLDQAAIISIEVKNEEDKIVAVTVAAAQCNEKEP